MSGEQHTALVRRFIDEFWTTLGRREEVPGSGGHSQRQHLPFYPVGPKLENVSPGAK